MDEIKKKIVRKKTPSNQTVTSSFLPEPRKSRKVVVSSRAIVVCGSPWASLEKVFDVLQAAGTAPAKEVLNGSIRSISDWHDRLLAGMDEVCEQIEPSRLWQLVAAEIFLTNTDLPVWGWADSRSTWLLDYWSEFDPGTLFVLVSVAPERMLASVIESGRIDVTDAMQAWSRYHAEILRFQADCPQRVVIVDADDVLRQPGEAAKEIFKSFGLPFADIGNEVLELNSGIYASPLTQLLSQQALSDADEVHALKSQLAQVLLGLSGSEGVDSSDFLADAASELADLKQALVRLKHVETERSVLAAEMVQLRGDLGKSQAEGASLQKESELLLKQLHLVQEELEKYFGQLKQSELDRDRLNRLSAERLHEIEREQLRQKELDVRLKSAESEKVKLTKELQAATATRETALKSHQASEQKLRSENVALKQDGVLLVQQLHQVQEELEGYFTKLQQSELEQARWNKLATEQEQALKQIQVSHADLVTKLKLLESEKTKLTKDLQIVTASRDAALKSHQASEQKLKSANDALAQDLEKLKQQQALAQKESKAHVERLNELNLEKTKLVDELHATMAARDAALQSLKLQQIAGESIKSDFLILKRDTELKQHQLDQVRDEAEYYVGQLQSVAQDKSRMQQLVDEHRQILNREIAQKNDLEVRLKTSEADRVKQNKLLQTAAAASKERLEAEQQLKSRNGSLQKENWLQQQQLSQVQEELELYFQQFRLSSTRVKELERLLAKVMTHAPAELMVKSVVPLKVNQEKSEVTWRIDGLAQGIRILPTFEVTSCRESGEPVLVFDSTAIEAAFVRASAKQVRVCPARHAGVVATLGNTDWQLVRQVAKAIEAACFKPLKTHAGSIPLDDAVWHADQDRLVKQLGEMPPSLRFDNVRLRSERTIDGYEHLWVSLGNVSFGSRYWQSFEFRIGAALLETQGFSNYPRLEFPQVQGEEPQFENWFAESEDDLGSKYELRFDLKNQAMDMQAWKALSDADRKLMFWLVYQLPVILTMLPRREHAARDIKEWRHLVTSLCVVFNKCLQLPVKQQTQSVRRAQSSRRIQSAGA